MPLIINFDENLDITIPDARAIIATEISDSNTSETNAEITSIVDILSDVNEADASAKLEDIYDRVYRIVNNWHENGFVSQALLSGGIAVLHAVNNRRSICLSRERQATEIVHSRATNVMPTVANPSNESMGCNRPTTEIAAAQYFPQQPTAAVTAPLDNTRLTAQQLVAAFPEGLMNAFFNETVADQHIIARAAIAGVEAMMKLPQRALARLWRGHKIDEGLTPRVFCEMMGIEEKSFRLWLNIIRVSPVAARAVSIWLRVPLLRVCQASPEVIAMRGIGDEKLETLIADLLTPDESWKKVMVTTNQCRPDVRAMLLLAMTVEALWLPPEIYTKVFDALYMQHHTEHNLEGIVRRIREPHNRDRFFKSIIPSNRELLPASLLRAKTFSKNDEEVVIDYFTADVNLGRQFKLGR